MGKTQNNFHQPAFNTELLSNVTFGQNSSDIWGMEKNGVKYAVIGNRNKVSVFSLEDPKKPKLRYEAPGDPSIWRDIKSYNNHLYVTADEGTGGVVIIDMTKAPDTITHINFKPMLTLGSEVNRELHRCHNLYIDENGFMYLAGCNVSKRGVLIFDLKSNPKLPKYVGAADLQYSHDAFTRGDTLYASEIYLGKISIYDVKDKSKPVLLAGQATSRAFTHNAWVSDNGKYVFTTDEKQGGYVDAYDITDLNNIKFLDKFRPLERENDGVIPHNTHYFNGYLITSWYTDGLRIVDAHKPDNLIEVAYYDTWEDPKECHNNFFGCWGAFPFTGSDIIYGSDINNGLYIVKVNYQRACYLEGKITDTNGNNISNALVQIISSQVNRELTGPSGEFKTGQAQDGTFKVKISHPEFFVKEVSVELKKGQVTILNTTMERKVPLSVVLDIKDNEGQNVSANIFFEGEPTSSLVQTSGNPDFKASVSSGAYNVFIAKWGCKNVFLPMVNVSPNKTNAISLTLEQGYEDNFETHLGWTTVNSNGVVGTWSRAEPRGILSGDGYITNPDKDSEDKGKVAWVTGNGIPGANCGDVDNGTTELRSPIFDLTSWQKPTLNYDIWYYVGNGTMPPNDTMSIKLSNGNTEVVVQNIIKSTNGWTKVRNLDIKSILPVTANMQLKIKVSDQDGVNAHIVEAGFDNFFISESATSSANDVSTDETIKVLPNPGHDLFYIQNKASNNNTPCIITDMMGRRIFAGMLSQETIIDATAWQSGLYFVKADGYKVVKFIKL